ncbi:MAG: IPT/TIG domain-containing protein [Prevotella sp.]|nr:IPT/TIG domain-containing protein [Prevotella sp.]
MLKYCTLLLIVMALGCFSSCSKDEDNSVRLDAFGPSPALRGGELRFLGSNLDRVTEIELPDDISIKDITKVSNGEIVIKLPQNVVPGYVKLKTPDGDITTKTKLTLSEPISIAKFYKTGSENITSVKAGDELTFEGDYLNLIREVVFTDNVVVSLLRDEDVTYSREKLVVKVPLGAQTGKVALSNGADIPILIYTDKELTVAAVSATSISPTTVKAGAELTIKGTNLQLVEKIKLEPNLEIAIPPATNPYADVTEIKLTIPENTHDGDVTLIAYSGLETNAGAITMLLPTVTTVTPNPVKGGEVLIIKGTNLDLVTNINFPNVGNAVECASKTASQITIVVPETAQTGTLSLNTNSGKSVSVNYNIVNPVVTSTSASIVGGESLTLHGTNLDLVSDVVFGSSSDNVQITSQTAIELKIIIPNTVVGSSKIYIKTKNGNIIEALTVTVTPTKLAYITSSLSSINAGETLTLIGGNFDKVTKVTLGGKDVTWSAANASTMFVVIPGNTSTGDLSLVLTTADGSASYSLSVIGTGPTVVSIWTGSQDMGGWSGSIQLGSSLFTSIKVGDVIRVTVDASSVTGSSQGSFKNGSWSQIAPGTEYFTITGDFTLTVTDDIKTSLLSGGLIISGQGYIATQVSILQY